MRVYDVIGALTSVQCDQMARLFIKIWPFTKKQIFSKASNFAKVGSKFGQILHKLSETMPKTF